MNQPSSHRGLVAVATVAFLFTLAAMLVAPTVAGASTDKRRAQSHVTLIKVETSKKYGKILVNASGRTLYFLTAETNRSLKCSRGCIGVWLPLLTKGRPHAGTGIAPKELGTVKRGSSRQVTYYGHPLYLYSGDKSSGQANGEGIAEFGGWWYVLGKTGSPVKAALTSSSRGTGGSRGSGGSGGSGAGW